MGRLEGVVDASGVAGRLEALLPVGVRPRQLQVRTLLVGMLASQADGRPAHLWRVHEVLAGLPEADQRRLGILTAWKSGPHRLTYRRLTYRQVEYTLAEMVDSLVEASIPDNYKTASSSLAVDWTGQETFSCPSDKDDPTKACADPEASWGHRRGDGPGQKDELFYGYYFSAATVVKDEPGPAVPELIRRITSSTCSVKPFTAIVPVLERLARCGVALGDILADSGYAHRVARNWALPLRTLGAAIVVDLHPSDLHPSDRGPQGTWAGAILANGNLYYCPATPAALLGLAPLRRGASSDETAAHDKLTAEAAHYKLAPISSDDAEGYHRPACPALTGKTRWPQRPESMALGYDRPEITTPPDPVPACCTQKTLTVPVTINASPSTPKPVRYTTTPPKPGGSPTPGAAAPNAPTPPSKTPSAMTSTGAGAGSWDSPPS